jgi:hypothetical protein
MTFPHVHQSSLFFNMFVLLHIGQKLHTQFLKFSLPPFFMALQVFKEKMTKIFVFQPILNCFTILESLEKFIFKKFID